MRRLSAASFKVLVEASWPALTSLSACAAKLAFDGPHALGAAAFAGFPALEELDLSEVALGEAGAALLASRRWPRLRKLELRRTQLGDAGLAALARGEWPALEGLDLRANLARRGWRWRTRAAGRPRWWSSGNDVSGLGFLSL